MTSPVGHTALLHATLAPSGAFQWAPVDGCKGSVAMQIRYPQDQDSEKAREGTAAHHYVSEMLQGRACPAGNLAPNGVAINSEMMDAGAGFINDVRLALTAATPGTVIRVEERVYMLCVHADCWGTPDCYMLDRERKTLNVWDYKYGHRYVDAFRNWQLILYAIGVLESEGVTDWTGWHIYLTIAQPRNYSPVGQIREWHIGGSALAEYVPALAEAARQAMEPGAPLQTGDHCRDCTARHACPALMRSAALSVDIAHEQTPMELTPAAVGLELQYLVDAEKRIKARKDALEEQALGLVRGGIDVPLWKADYSAGRERWLQPAAQVAALGDMWGVDLRKPLEAITPNQARKAGIDGTVIDAYAEKPRGSLRLVAVTDASVSKAFS